MIKTSLKTLIGLYIIHIYIGILYIVEKNDKFQVLTINNNMVVRDFLYIFIYILRARYRRTNGNFWYCRGTRLPFLNSMTANKVQRAKTQRVYHQWLFLREDLTLEIKYVYTLAVNLRIYKILVRYFKSE